GCNGLRFAGIVIGPRDLVLFNESLIADAVSLGTGPDRFILLQFVLRGSQVRLLRRDTRERLRFGGFGGMELAEGARVHDGNRYLRRMRLRCAGRTIRFCMFELSRIVSRIELDQKCSRFQELVILHARIDVNYRSTDPRAHQVQMPFNLGIIGGLVVLRVDPPKGSSGNSNRRRKKKDPPRNASTWDLAWGFRLVAGKLSGRLARFAHARAGRLLQIPPV